MGNIKKAGSYFYKIANFLVLAVIINMICFIFIITFPSPEKIAADYRTIIQEAAPPAGMGALYAQAAKEAKIAEYERQLAEKINENIKIRSYATNVLICLNSFLTILLVYNLYKAAYCLIEYDKIEKVEEPNIQKE